LPEHSVVVADLCGFTSFAAYRDPREVSSVRDAYFREMIPPIVREYGGEFEIVDDDAVLATFSQPDHALRAARAALAIQQVAEQIAGEHPSWPRFRVGVGDTADVAARLEASAPLGSVAVGASTLQRLPRRARAESLGPVRVQGRAAPVDAYVLAEL
jgi:adenylate cyclase